MLERLNLEDKNETIGYVEYEIKDDSLYVNKVYVRDDYRGQGKAQELMSKIIDLSIVKNKKIVPLCSYAQKYMESIRKQK
ncbi:MAG TPA: GNAT family N-acetyltransferase [Candidatus Onthovivens sp.]|nr:GNAT family N-acetyltransferase [Candidatus Onthovivens sp.]